MQAPTANPAAEAASGATAMLGRAARGNDCANESPQRQAHLPGDGWPAVGGSSLHNARCAYRKHTNSIKKLARTILAGLLRASQLSNCSKRMAEHPM
jgi:hypothetical protein